MVQLICANVLLVSSLSLLGLLPHGFSLIQHLNLAQVELKVFDIEDSWFEYFAISLKTASAMSVFLVMANGA